MMKPYELQIGDYVCYDKPNGYITRVDAIRRFGDETLGYVYSIDCKRDERDPLYKKAPVDSFNVEILHPIQLTEEMLEKNGFTDNYIYDDLCYAMSCGDVIGIHINGKGGCMEEMYFTNVHELQNAMRLCGFDNEIKLKD